MIVICSWLNIGSRVLIGDFMFSWFSLLIIVVVMVLWKCVLLLYICSSMLFLLMMLISWLLFIIGSCDMLYSFMCWYVVVSRLFGLIIIVLCWLYGCRIRLCRLLCCGCCRKLLFSIQQLLYIFDRYLLLVLQISISIFFGVVCFLQYFSVVVRRVLVDELLRMFFLFSSLCVVWKFLVLLMV